MLMYVLVVYVWWYVHMCAGYVCVVVVVCACMCWLYVYSGMCVC